MNSNKGNAAHKFKAEEINEFNLPTIVSSWDQWVKPEEEVQRFAIAEGLSEVDRIKELLLKKNELQQSYVFVNAVNIFKADLEVQKQIMPLILKNVNNWNENLQTQAGNAFAELLEQKILIQEFYDGLREICISMFKQWSKQVLQAWIDVYALLLREIRESQGPANFDKHENEIVQFITKMADKQSPISVRISATYFLKAVTVNKSFSSEQVFINKILSRVKSLCQDVNWEIRLGTSKQLIDISNYIGKDNSLKYVLPEILEHIEDEESEVKVQGIRQYVKHLKTVFSQQYINSTDCLKVVHTIFSNFSDPHASQDIKDIICRKLPRIMECLNNSSDKVLLQLAQDILAQSQNSEHNKFCVAKSMRALSQVYSLDNQFFPHFYSTIFSHFLKEEIQGHYQTVKIQIAKYIHSIVKNSFVNGMMQEKNLQQKVEVMDLYGQMLKLNERPVLNQLLLNAHELFDLFYNCKEQLEPQLHEEFQKIKRALLTQVEKLITQNWRFHKNYFDFIHKILFICTNDEASTEILPLMMKSLRAPNTTLPVRSLITSILADGIFNLPNATFRAATHGLMTKEIATHGSSQIRIIYLQFLEHMIPQISKQQFKTQYMEAYFKFKDEQIYSILFQYVKIAPIVRMKVDDNRSIDRIEQSLKAINNKFSTNKKAKDLLIAVEETLIKLKDNDFLDEANFTVDFKDKELVQHEVQLQQAEKEIKSRAQRGEKLGLDQYNRKAGSTLGVNSVSSSLGTKDLKVKKQNTQASSLVLSKNNKSEQQKGKLELPGQGKYKEETKTTLAPKKSPMAQPLPKPSPGKKK